MKKFTFLFFSIFLLFSYAGKTQQAVVVPPGVGTLNAAITANGGNAIYHLTAGQWYQLNAIIENVDYHLQIIGDAPAVAGGMPATLQTGDDAGGAVFAYMFDSKGDITLKNVYFVNADLNGVTGTTGFLHQSTPGARTIINKCVIQPVSGANGIVLDGAGSITYFTDNLSVDTGHELNPNDGHFFITGNNGANVDTLLVENNTFVCSPTTMHSGGFNANVDNFSKWDHNTFVEQKSQIDWQDYEKEYYWTNNLMFDVNTQPWAVTWQPMPGADPGYPQPALIYADTIPGDVLPSKTIQFVEYNMLYRNPKFYTMLSALNVQGKIDSKPFMYYMPLVWPLDSIKRARETKMFADKVDFPFWKVGNTSNSIDPKWVDTRIYTMSDNFVAWTKPATMLHGQGYATSEVPDVSTWTQYWWDPDGDLSNNSTWPLFNGVYTDPSLLTGSIEGLPLGDLNWYPDAKAKWLNNKAKIDAHMKSADDSKIDLTTGVQINKSSDVSTSCYPNPFSDQLTISYTVKNMAKVSLSIINLTGQTVNELVNQSMSAGNYTARWNGKNIEGKSLPDGVYFYKLQIGNDVSNTRILKVK